MPEIYDEEYFEYGLSTGKSGYENYRWLPDRLYGEARAVIKLLGINPKSSVLDFGCAKGYMVKALRHYNIESFGCDISKYALENSDTEIKEFLSNDIPSKKFDFVVSRNTFEHIEECELVLVMKRLIDVSSTMFFTVPLVDPRTGDYVMQMPDSTHKIRWTNAQWMSFCEKCGWKYVASYPHVDGFHENYRQYPNAMGFYVLKV